jgi:hypothetical protein
MRKLSLHVLRSLCCCGAGHDIPIKMPLVQYSRMYIAGDSCAKFLDDGKDRRKTSLIYSKETVSLNELFKVY